MAKKEYSGTISSDNYRIINEYELFSLLMDAHIARALDNGGVDDWSFYGDAINNYLDGESIDSFAEKRMSKYPEFKYLEDENR